MLVLSRKNGERILIGDNIAITVVRINPGSVRLGIDAPRDMSIVREELIQQIAQQTGGTVVEGASGMEIEVELPGTVDVSAVPAEA